MIFKAMVKMRFQRGRGERKEEEDWKRGESVGIGWRKGGYWTELGVSHS